MSRRLTWLLALAALVALAVAPTAGAKKGDKSSLKLTKGTATVTLDPAVLAALQAAGVTVDRAGSAKSPSAGTFVFKVKEGRVAQDLSSGEVRHSGGLELTNAATSVRATKPTVVLAGAVSKLTIRVDNARIDLATLDLSAVKPVFSGRNVTLTGVPLKLTDAAAGALNAAFGTVFAGATTIGTADFAAKLNGRSAKLLNATKDNRGRGKDDGTKADDKAARAKDDGAAKADDHGVHGANHS